MKLHESGATLAGDNGSARFEDAGSDRSPDSSFLENGPGS